MPRSTRLSQYPLLTRQDFATHYETPCEMHYGLDGNPWYMGSGIAPKDHPLKHVIRFGKCAYCGSTQVLVIAAHHTIHPFNNIEMYDYEMLCAECHYYTIVAYASDRLPGMLDPTPPPIKTGPLRDTKTKSAPDPLETRTGIYRRDPNPTRPTRRREDE